MGWIWWLRASWTYTILLLGELDNAVQDIQQPFPAGEMVCVRGLLVHALGPRRQSSVFPPTLAWAVAHLCHQVLAVVTLPGWAGSSYQPMGFGWGERVQEAAPFQDGSKPGCCCLALTWI